MARVPLYATPFGKTYHRDALCTGLNAWYTANGHNATVPEVSRPVARRRGLKPCFVCGPPPLLRVVTS